MSEKHILALSSSPSRGRNSDTLLDAFIDGIKRVDKVTVEKIYLEDIHLDYYTYENKSGPLPHEESFRHLTEKLKTSHGLVIATPTYNFSVPAHLKNFIDRIRFLALDFQDKNVLGQPTGKLSHLCTYFIVTGGTPSWAQKILFFAFPPFWLRGVFLYYGAKVRGALYTGDKKAYENMHLKKILSNRGRVFARNILRGGSQGIVEHFFWRPPQRDE